MPNSKNTIEIRTKPKLLCVNIIDKVDVKAEIVNKTTTVILAILVPNVVEKEINPPSVSASYS